MKVLSALSKLKGNLKVISDYDNVEITEDKDQVSVTKSYTITGVDLSGEVTGIRAKEDTEEWLEEAEGEVSHFLEGLKKDFTNFEQHTPNYDMYFKNDENLVGFHVEASVRPFKNKAELSKLTLEVEIVAFYDVPHFRLKRLMDEGIKALTGLEIK